MAAEHQTQLPEVTRQESSDLAQQLLSERRTNLSRIAVMREDEIDAINWDLQQGILREINIARARAWKAHEHQLLRAYNSIQVDWPERSRMFTEGVNYITHQLHVQFHDLDSKREEISARISNTVQNCVPQSTQTERRFALPRP